ncbi:uncharacterized protein FOMMEDRAFT_145863, partial [Fomitiporia mediterranea MF3/22]|uniref:uncharacterized protein n=1 Tax=Fomitiporia mediterranea (strain MF3/22) TaxID=694068 RepID=UPI0004407FA4
MDVTQPTERTPLIEHSGSASDSLPYILELERSIYADAAYPAVHTIIEQKVDAYTTSPSIGLTLKLLLCLRYLSGSYFQLDKADWVDSRSVEQDATELALRCWSELQRVAWSQAAFDEALWTEFPLENGRNGTGWYTSLIKTILTNKDGLPHSIQLDDRIALSLLRVWKKGRPRQVHSTRASSRDTLMMRIESFATPRVLHLANLAFFLAYLAIIAKYILNTAPTYSKYVDGPDYHFYCITIYAISRILGDSWPSTTPFVLTLMAFLSALPGMPGRHEISHNVLLIAFALHVVQLLLLRSPSLSLLDPCSSTFVPSLMLQNLLVSVFMPTFLLFVPYLILLLVLLAVSFHDIFLGASTPMAFDIFIYCVFF